ncbi:hypothetical protein BsIDN1_64630 [Bacillus safensis]|uniref:Uncharacterized protein n=1 Tax=Bacillus safensis TaxID=561879 RepID=A0A5S9MJ85_BACIA|nr:hypothetical protein BsIDN1_64630 [Bacillus safensis]
MQKALTDTKQDFEDHQAEGKNIVYVVSDGEEKLVVEALHKQQRNYMKTE